MFTRSSGILVHPTSFPNKYGVGDFGTSAYEYIDFLQRAHQKLWQILPINPVNNTYSPYSPISAFAGNTLLISIDRLVDDGLLMQADIIQFKSFVNELDFEMAKELKNPLLKKAFDSFCTQVNTDQRKAFITFCNENSFWLEDFSLFISLQEYYDFSSWSTWPEEIKYRNSSALKNMKKKLGMRISYHKFLQYKFYKQWNDLKTYANIKGISIIGDIPIYMPFECVDVWCNPELFLLNQDFSLSYIPGGPPDAFSAKGQRWDNCLYDWTKHQETNYIWWISRLKFTLQIADILRLDHFRGFDEYWTIPFEEDNPANGKWEKGPGEDFFHEILKVENISIIVEDVGIITKSVEQLREKFDLTGIKIFQMGFDGEVDNGNLIQNFTTTNCVAYSGTHDSDTIRGWYNNCDKNTKQIIQKYLHHYYNDIGWSVIGTIQSSIAVFSIFQIQDILGLGSEHRMNIPEPCDRNWKFCYSHGSLTKHLCDKLASLTDLFNRD